MSRNKPYFQIAGKSKKSLKSDLWFIVQGKGDINTIEKSG